MNVSPMVSEVVCIANPMIGESALPYLGAASDKTAEFMRVSAFDQLDGALDGYVLSRGKQKMDMIGHEDKVVQRVAAFATVVMQSFE
ncbi:MAG: hypothetical protein WA718_21655 [Terriglobales bacterium]